LFLPLPMALLAGMGFVAVFSGATNTPIACTLMGIELFGMEAGVFIALACVTAYLFSGSSGIYSAQIIGSAKSDSLKNTEGKALHEV
jgi:H+/Cl- antiporter ClcA